MSHNEVPETVPAEAVEPGSSSPCPNFLHCDACDDCGSHRCVDPAGAMSVLVGSLLHLDNEVIGAIPLPVERYATMLFGTRSDEEWQARQLVKAHAKYMAAVNSLAARIEQRAFEEAQVGPASGVVTFRLGDIEDVADLEAYTREHGVPESVVPLMAQNLAEIRDRAAAMRSAQAEEAVPETAAEADDANTNAAPELALAADAAEELDCGCADCRQGE